MNIEIETIQSSDLKIKVFKNSTTSKFNFSK